MKRVYLLWTHEYCPVCEESHQYRYRTDKDLVSVFLSRTAAFAFLLGHPRYIAEHEQWCWLIEEWAAIVERGEVDGELCSPHWRLTCEIIEAGIARKELDTIVPQPPAWPYSWWYSRTGAPLVDCPDYLAEARVT
jgi:hypothetical protein